MFYVLIENLLSITVRAPTYQVLEKNSVLHFEFCKYKSYLLNLRYIDIEEIKAPLERKIEYISEKKVILVFPCIFQE